MPMRRRKKQETADPLTRYKGAIYTFLWGYLSRYKMEMGWAFLAVMMASSTVLALGWGLRSLVDNGLSQGNEEFLDQSLLVLLIVVTILALASYGRYFMVSHIGEKLVRDLRHDTYHHIMRLDPVYFEMNKTGDVISRLTSDTTVLRTVLAQTLPVAIRNIFMTVGGLALLCYTSPKLTFQVIMIVPIVVLSIVFFGRKVRQLSKKSQEMLGSLSGYADETIHAVQMVQAFGQEPHVEKKFKEDSNIVLNVSLSYIRARALLTGFVIFIVFGAIGLILWQGGHDVLNNRITAGELSSFVFYALLVAGSVGALSEVSGAVQTALGATERLMDVLEEPILTDYKTAKLQDTDAKGVIQFNQVSFTYPTRSDKPALSKLNLTIQAGEKIAIVGPSGSGKTTMVQLLMGFYPVNDGQITIGGHIQNAENAVALRHDMAIVPQEPMIFSDTVFENIRFGRPDASFSDVVMAAKHAYADEFIDKLPQKYDTQLGEKGSRLSGGQKQRIAIARAILRDPTYLLLDEATSALDAQSEEKVQSALWKLMEERTTIMIAHRLSTVQNADRIIVLDQGQLVEEGTHDKMIGQEGLYAHLAKLQLNA